MALHESAGPSSNEVPPQGALWIRGQRGLLGGTRPGVDGVLGGEFGVLEPGCGGTLPLDGGRSEGTFGVPRGTGIGGIATGGGFDTGGATHPAHDEVCHGHCKRSPCTTKRAAA